MNRRGFVSGALAAGAAACSRDAPRAPSVFEGELGAVTAELFAEAPEWARIANPGAKTPRLIEDGSAEAMDLRRAASLRRMAQWRSLDPRALDAGERVTYDVLDHYFASLAAGARFGYGRFSATDGFSPYVLGHRRSAYARTQSLLAAAPALISLDDAAQDIALLRALPAALDEEAAVARADAQRGVTPPGFVLDRALALVASVIEAPPDAIRLVQDFRRRLEAVAGPLAPEAAPETPARSRARALFAEGVLIAAQQIQPAYRRTWATLAHLRERAGIGAGMSGLPDGATAYRARLAVQASSKAAPGELHALGLARVQAANGQLDMVLRSQGLAEGSPGERLAQLAADPRFRYAVDPAARALADMSVHQQRVLSQLPRWFADGPRAPPSLRLDAGGAPAGDHLFRLQGDAVHFAPATLATLPRFELAALSHYAALPGNLLQTRAAVARSALPPLRRALRFSAYHEGWASYAEHLADDMGLYEGDPLSRIGFLRRQARRAALLAADTGLHAMDWSREQAIAYLIDVTGENSIAAEAEVAAIAAAPGEACAPELGRLAILQQRDRAQTALGQTFGIRAFHAAVLSDAELPPALLAERIGAWIARKGAP